MTAVDPCLALYGTLVAVIVPWVLVRQRAIDNAPLWGVVAWLVIAVSVLGSWLAAAVSLTLHSGDLAQAAGYLLLATLVTRLAWASFRTWSGNRSRRARHADAAVLLGRPDAGLGAIIVDSPQPAAYCLPHHGGGLIVVTTGAQSLLSARQLDAVLSHERAHLAGRHHVVLSIGQALSRAFPHVLPLRQLAGQVQRLLEMCADDVAARTYGRTTVARAIVAMGANATPGAALGAGGSSAVSRARRLAAAAPVAWRSRLALAATAALVAVGPYLATLAPCPHPW